MAPVVNLPKRFDGTSMTQVAGQVARLRADGERKSVIFNFSPLEFVRPAGIVFLSNLIKWLEAKDCEVTLHHPRVPTTACKYLDDSEFFLHHCRAKLWQHSKVRSTTLPLQRIRHDRIHPWLRMTLIPWLSASTNSSEEGLYEFQVCISEIFNNIVEHTQFNIGSIFVQHYPNEKRVIIVVADFGRGIPTAVRTILPDIIDDAQAIIQAVQEGFTTKSIATNQGNGLDILLKSVVKRNRGWVTIYSRRGVVRFEPCGTNVEQKSVLGVGFCPGTLIEINLRTDTIEDNLAEAEEFEW